jgi:thiamine-monophosphate kinase
MAEAWPDMRGEDRWIASWIGACPAPDRRLLLGPGHDCAWLKPPPPGRVAVLKTDLTSEGVHFRKGEKPEWVGRKAVARVLSDFAATGAVPVALLVAVSLGPKPGPRHIAYVRRAYAGMRGLLKQWNVVLAGGETSRGAGLGFTVSGYGWGPRLSLRSRAGSRPGDRIFVTGRLGASLRGKHLRFQPRLREGQWLAKQGWCRAMMDLSDGLGKDLPRLAASSGLSFAVDPSSLPRTRGATCDQAVNDGEDYELLFTVQASKAAALVRAWPFSVPLACIGRMLAGGRPAETGGLLFRGYDHGA